MTLLSSTALSGLKAAQIALQGSAHNVANLGTREFRRLQVEPVSRAEGGVSTRLATATSPGNAPGADLVDQLQAKNAFLANLAVFKTDSRMLGSLLDTRG